MTHPHGQRPGYGEEYPPAGFSGQGHPVQPPQQRQHPPIEPSRRRKKWPWVVGGVVVLLVIISVASRGNGQNPAASAPPAADPAASPAKPAEDLEFGEKIVTLSVEGKGKALVSYIKSGGTEQKDVNLPWKADIKTDFVSSLTAQRKSGGNGEIKCKITDGSEIVAESTSSGAYAVVSCAG